MDSIHDGSHLSEETLGECALGRLSKGEISSVFEHLLICDQCNERYEAEVTFRNNVRAAGSRGVNAQTSEKKRGWRDVFAIPRPAWAAVAALVIFAAFLPLLRDDHHPLQIVELTAVRGGQTAAVPAQSLLELRLAATALEAGKPVQVQIVNESGAQVWRGTASPTGQWWQVQPGRQLAAGRYWVRVFDTAEATQPMREYSLELR